MMFAKGPAHGVSFKDQALAILPAGTHCKRVSAMGITGYVVYLPDGRGVGSAGSSGNAWRDALDWASRNLPQQQA
jgi:hypothetical protein